VLPLFPPPGSTRNWASRGVFGERVWAERKVVPLAYGLIRLDVVATVAGLLLLQVAKAWYIDRQVLLFEDMKNRHQPYADWER
jgi:hypothetical protein